MSWLDGPLQDALAVALGVASVLAGLSAARAAAGAIGWLFDGITRLWSRR